MKSVFYRPIYYTWLALVISMLVGLVVWIVGSRLSLSDIFAEDYSYFPSPLFVMLAGAAGVAVVVFLESFMHKRLFTFLAMIAVPIAIAVVVVLLDWMLGTWGSRMILIAIPVVLGGFMGIQLMLFVRKRVEAGVWIVFALILVFAALTWWSSFVDSNLLSLAVILFYFTIVAVCLGYAAVIIAYTIIVRKILGV
jgi:hypothetical protein